MDGGASFYIYLAIAAAGSAYSAHENKQANRRRQAILEQELRSNELAALDEENRRIQMLREANDDMLANSGGIEAWASPSFLAAREFNFKMLDEDVKNIRYNTQATKADIGARIAILKRNSRAVWTKSIFDVATTAAYGSYKGSLLGSTTKRIPKGGKGGLNAEMGLGILDTPGGTGAIT